MLLENEKPQETGNFWLSVWLILFWPQALIINASFHRHNRISAAVQLAIAQVSLCGRTHADFHNSHVIASLAGAASECTPTRFLWLQANAHLRSARESSIILQIANLLVLCPVCPLATFALLIAAALNSVLATLCGQHSGRTRLIDPDGISRKVSWKLFSCCAHKSKSTENRRTS